MTNHYVAEKLMQQQEARVKQRAAKAWMLQGLGPNAHVDDSRPSVLGNLVRGAVRRMKHGRGEAAASRPGSTRTPAGKASVGVGKAE